ncbi:hypothetical protein C8Q79DRAFT_924162 [Trametes meyenii]|nr:hypothetical protein C8Q79DRAFT_924162 [Trametes meyenii]
MDKKILVVPYDEMLERFLPEPAAEQEPTAMLAGLNFRSGGESAVEADMYEPLIKASNTCGLLPGLIGRATPNKGDSSVESDEKIDGGLYPQSDDVPVDADRTNWSTIELSIECKMEPVQDDPFDDTRTINFQPMAHRRRKVLGQILSYAVLVFNNQHRTHHFTLVVLGCMARIVRWDRSGAFVSEKFNYVENPLLLGRFLWRYARLSPLQRGHDLSATPLVPGSLLHKLVLKRRDHPYTVGAHSIGEHAREEFRKSTMDERSFWKLEVNGPRKARAFLVGKPHFIADGLAGRGTRGYVAIDLEDPAGPLVYLKDAWRVDHPRMRQEGDILSYLTGSEGGKVNYVPTLICHGDVDGQVTASQAVWKAKHPDAKDEDCPLKTHRHYRLVVKEVGLPITEFRSGMELVYYIMICITAHRQAYNKGVLHRDISSGNVLIHVKEQVGPDGKLRQVREGLLTDWELSKFIHDPEGGPRQPGRTGTWQFLSAHALADLSKKIVVEDEMESFFHLLLYLSIRYLLHNCTNVGDFADKYFDGFTQNGEEQEYYVGDVKYSAMSHGEIKISRSGHLEFWCRQLGPSASSSEPFELPGPHPINVIFATMLSWLRAHYLLSEEKQTKNVETTPARPALAADPLLTAVIEESHATIDAFLAEIFGDNSSQPTPTTSTLASAPKNPISAAERAELEALAAKLGSHEEVVKLFGEQLRRKKPDGTSLWPVDDKVKEDQLPVDYRPRDEREIGTKRSFVDSYASASAGEPRSKKTNSYSLNLISKSLLEFLSSTHMHYWKHRCRREVPDGSGGFEDRAAGAEAFGAQLFESADLPNSNMHLNFQKPPARNSLDRAA